MFVFIKWSNQMIECLNNIQILKIINKWAIFFYFLILVMKFSCCGFFFHWAKRVFIRIELQFIFFYFCFTWVFYFYRCNIFFLFSTIEICRRVNQLTPKWIRQEFQCDDIKIIIRELNELKWENDWMKDDFLIFEIYAFFLVYFFCCCCCHLNTKYFQSFVSSSILSSSHLVFFYILFKVLLIFLLMSYSLHHKRRRRLPFFSVL